MKIDSCRSFRALALVLALTLCISVFSGCSARKGNPVIAQVGNHEVTYSQYYATYNTYNAYYSYGMITVQDESNAEAELSKLAFNNLIDEFVLVAKAEQLGYTLSTAEEAQVRQDFDAQIQQLLDQYAQEGEELSEAEKMKALEKELKQSGYTYKAYTESVLQTLRNDVISSKLREEILNSVSVTEDDVRSWYDTEVKAESEVYAADPGMYYSDYMNAVYYGQLQPLVVPEGYTFLKQVLVMNPKEGETKDVDAIVAEVMGKIEAGEDFQALIGEYNDDPGMDTFVEGYLMHEAIRDIYYKEFSDAAMALEVGEISEPVKTDVGTHIIMKVRAAEAGTAAYEDVKDDIYDIILSERQNAAYEEAVAEWKQEIPPKIYTKRLQYFGITAADTASGTAEIPSLEDADLSEILPAPESAATPAPESNG